MTDQILPSHFWSFPFCPVPPLWQLDWEGLESQFKWIRDMRGCLQDPAYHAEGDVLTHTRKVVEALISLPAWQQLSSPARSTVFAAALLHDAAKPAYTQVEADGRVT